MIREDNTVYILSLSYGKDSLACLEAIKLLGWPLDRIIHVEVWATDTIPADLPPMVEFKKKADEIIMERYGIKVEHICATKDTKKLTYEGIFYRQPKRGGQQQDLRLSDAQGTLVQLRPQESSNQPITGFATKWTQYCTGELKKDILKKFSKSSLTQGAKINIVYYLGIAVDEPERIERHRKPGVLLPLVEIGWSEADCRKWCEENDLLSPIYSSAMRVGCWFCHNQSISQLRLLRKNYPDLWNLLLKWDSDSPVTFHADGHTVHDFERRFQLEDEGKIPTDRRFRWKMLEEKDEKMIEKVREAMVNAMKSGDKPKKEAMSSLLDALLKAEKEQRKPLSEADAAKVIRKEIKQLQDTLKYANKLGRNETIEECEYRIALYEEYLPTGLSDEQIVQMIDQIFTEGNTTKGSIMKELMPQVDGRANGSNVARLVGAYLKVHG